MTPLASIHLLGPAELRADVVTTLEPQRSHQLLVLLALQTGQWVPRERVAALLWPEHAGAEARRNLRKVIFKARTVAGTTALEAGEHALRWTVDGDVQRFRTALSTGDVATAVALWRGTPFDGLETGAPEPLARWLAGERMRLEQQWHAAALAQLERLPSPTARAELAHRLLAVDAADERAVIALLRSLLEQGDIAGAQAAYRQYALHLAESLGIEPAQSVADLVRPTRAPGPGVNGPPAAGPESHAAGASFDDDAGGFVGRRLETAELRRLVASPSTRLVSVVGPGGIGKSRLCRQLTTPWSATADRIGVADAPWRWVALDDVPDAFGALARIAQALQIEPPPATDALASLVVALQGRSCRLVLDNVEHLSDLPAVIGRLLQGAAGLQLVVTTRQRLHLAEEQVLPLVGLAVPDEESHEPQVACTFDAVRLFLERARRASPSLDLVRHMDAVIDIVKSVDGMPLAIELAAAWVRLLPPPQIADSLSGSLELLERDPTSTAALARATHVSLRGVLRQSWALLAPRERSALAALSVFAGGFTHQTAHAVAGCSMALLSSLVDRSLVGPETDGRFALHPVVANFAAEQLATVPEERTRRRRSHAEHFARWLASLQPLARTAIGSLLRQLGPDEGNVRAAWSAAVEMQRDDLVADLVPVLCAWLENLGRQREAVAMLAPAFARAGATPTALRARARVGEGLALAHLRQGEHAQAEAVARAASVLAARCGEIGVEVACVNIAAACHWQLRDEPAAQASFERAIALADQHGDPHGLAVAQGGLGQLLRARGHATAARDLLQRALDGSRALGDTYHVCAQLMALAACDGDDGHTDAALAHLREARRLAASHGLRLVETYAVLNLGHELRRSGADVEARAAYLEAMALTERTGEGVVRWTADLALARLDVRAGEPAAALSRLRDLVAQLRAHGATWHLVWSVVVYGHAQKALERWPEAGRAFAAALATGWLEARFNDELRAELQQLPSDARPASAASLDALLDEMTRR